MLPTITKGHPFWEPGSARHGKGDVAHSPTPASRLDAWLFRAGSWFAIDANNQTVPGVRPPTVEAGLPLVGRGRVAAIVGRLRAGAAVVDVDVEGGLGEYAAHEVTSWAHAQSYWSLLRPSGGARGRHHVFIAHPDLTRGSDRWAELEDYLAGLAAGIGVRGRALDLRDSVRALSSPHRHGGITKPYGNLADSLRDLRRLLPEPPAIWEPVRATKTRTTPPAAPVATAGRRRELRPEWAAYFAHGIVPPRLRTERTRSLIEAQATAELVWAGHTEESGWRLIQTAHPAAMGKARSQRRGWWNKYVWDKAVADVAQYRHAHGHPEPAEAAPAARAYGVVPPEVAVAVEAARRRLEDLLWTQPVRGRATIGLVGHILLDRITRTATKDGQVVLRVPCPERDLVLDTGIRDRKTIRAALRLLHGTVGTLHRDALSHALPDRASTSFEFSIEPVSLEGVREIPPPRVFHPPLPWAALPRVAHAVWRALEQGGSQGRAITQVAITAQITTSPQDTPTRSQLDTTRRALQSLAAAGLAVVDEHGRWHQRRTPARAYVARAIEHGDALRDLIDAERAAYRSPAAHIERLDTWAAGRERAYKKQLAHHKAWWDGLSPAERAQRRAARRLEFAQLPIAAQAQRKARLADRRRHAGLSERVHHQDWLASLSPDEYAERSLRHQQRYEQLSPPDQWDSVRAWQHHRDRYGLPDPRASAGPAAELDLLPDTTAERDAALLRHQTAPAQPALVPATG